MRNSQYRMIINLTPQEELEVEPLKVRIKLFGKKFDIPASKLNAEGLAARKKFFEDCNRLTEIYQPYFDKCRRQQKISKKGKKYLENLNNPKLHC